MNVAQTILEQLGGNRFRVMTGAKNFVGSDDSLSFRLPGAGFCRDGINSMRITLNSMDLYDVRYYRNRGTKITLISESLGVYADMLSGDFEHKTGLCTSLGTMGKVEE